MKKLRAWLGDKKHRMLQAAIGLWVIAHSLDMLSTVSTLAIVPGMVEGNPFGTNPLTGEFSFGGLVFALSYVDTLLVFLPALALYVGTDRTDVASIPFWYNAFNTLPVVVQNFGYLFLYLRFMGGF